jgi:hypothetical protein
MSTPGPKGEIICHFPLHALHPAHTHTPGTQQILNTHLLQKTWKIKTATDCCCLMSPDHGQALSSTPSKDQLRWSFQQHWDLHPFVHQEANAQNNSNHTALAVCHKVWNTLNNSLHHQSTLPTIRPPKSHLLVFTLLYNHLSYGIRQTQLPNRTWQKWWCVTSGTY